MGLCLCRCLWNLFRDGIQIPARWCVRFLNCRLDRRVSWAAAECSPQHMCNRNKLTLNKVMHQNISKILSSFLKCDYVSRLRDCILHWKHWSCYDSWIPKDWGWNLQHLQHPILFSSALLKVYVTLLSKEYATSVSVYLSRAGLSSITLCIGSECTPLLA